MTTLNKEIDLEHVPEDMLKKLNRTCTSCGSLFAYHSKFTHSCPVQEENGTISFNTTSSFKEQE